MSTTPTLNIHPGWLRPRVAVRPEPVPFPVLVRALRMTRELSQEAFAEIVGLERRTIAAIERSERAPTLPTCIAIATGLRLSTTDRVRLIESAGYLLTGEEDAP